VGRQSLGQGGGRLNPAWVLQSGSGQLPRARVSASFARLSSPGRRGAHADADVHRGAGKAGACGPCGLGDSTRHTDVSTAVLAILPGPDWSLCAPDLQAGEAVFVRLASGHDPMAAGFVYADRFAHTLQVAEMPMAALLALADRIAAPSRLLFLFSTGRCGSTLASRILAVVPGCCSPVGA